MNREVVVPHGSLPILRLAIVEGVVTLAAETPRVVATVDVAALRSMAAPADDVIAWRAHPLGVMLPICMWAHVDLPGLFTTLSLWIFTAKDLGFFLEFLSARKFILKAGLTLGLK